jgi:hypothetical protein
VDATSWRPVRTARRGLAHPRGEQRAYNVGRLHHVGLVRKDFLAKKVMDGGIGIVAAAST